MWSRLPCRRKSTANLSIIENNRWGCFALCSVRPRFACRSTSERAARSRCITSLRSNSQHAVIIFLPPSLHFFTVYFWCSFLLYFPLADTAFHCCFPYLSWNKKSTQCWRRRSFWCCGTDTSCLGVKIKNAHSLSEVPVEVLELDKFACKKSVYLNIFHLKSVFSMSKTHNLTDGSKNVCLEWRITIIISLNGSKAKQSNIL